MWNRINNGPYETSTLRSYKKIQCVGRYNTSVVEDRQLKD